MRAIDGVYMSMRTKAFRDRNVRRALTLALNRPALVNQAWGPAVTPFEGYVPPGETGYDPSLKVLPYGAQAARAALKAAGYPSGKSFPAMTLYYPNDPPQFASVAQLVAKAWHKTLGITVDTQALTLNTLLFKAQSDALPLYLSGWSADYPDPHDWLSLQWRSDALNNNVRYNSKAFDSRVESADVTWSFADRMRLYNEAQQILVDDAAWIPLFIPHRMAFIRPGVTNLVLTGYGLIPRSGSWSDIRMQLNSPKRHRAF